MKVLRVNIEGKNEAKASKRKRKKRKRRTTPVGVSRARNTRRKKGEEIHAFLSFVLHDYYKNIDQSDLVFFNENDPKEKYHYREAKSILTKI